MDNSLDNATWSISDLSTAIKSTLSNQFNQIRLRGEISGFRGAHSSGHCYFSLTDGDARIDTVLWRNSAKRFSGTMENGLEIIATGSVTTWAPASRYQFVVEHIEPAGIGAMMAALAKRKEALNAEGIFDSSQKQLLPPFPRVVGVVTSPTGAVIRDILHRLSERFPVHVIVWPVRVQGEGSANEVAAAIRGFNDIAAKYRRGEATPVPPPDALIVARGGGSVEDLWGFNDEELVRTASRCTIPLVSAIGHETDWTLLDLVADVRAPTPTAAAEFVVPVRDELISQITNLANRQDRVWTSTRSMLKSRLTDLSRAIPDADFGLGHSRQSFDMIWARMQQAMTQNLSNQRNRFELLSGGSGKRQLLASINHLRSKVLSLLAVVHQQTNHQHSNFRHTLTAQGRLMENLGHHATLNRGFALVWRHTTDSRTIVSSASALTAAERITIEFSDSTLLAQVVNED